MHDSFSIWHDDRSFQGSRYLWEDDAGAIFQTIFYQHHHRADPTAYCTFAADDAAMNVVAERMLAELVEEAAGRRGPR